MTGELLRQLAERAGIEPAYRDTWGQSHQTSDATIQALLAAMDLPSGSDEQMHDALARIEAGATGPLPESAVARRAWQPSAFQNGGRGWGFAVQLYALQTTRTWGIGDFSALAELLRGASALGACAIGVNPLHALFPTRPEHVSPYSPSSRRFINPLYLDVEAVEDFATCEPAREMAAAEAFQSRLREARMAPRVQYGTVTALKFRILSLLYDAFRARCLDAGEHPRGAAFRRFQSECGPALRRFAIFHVLAETLPEYDWRRWPAEFTDPDSPAVAAFASAQGRAVEFHEYLQWQAALQLQHAHAVAQECGMSIGLYADLAVGADPTGAECWSAQRFLAQGATVGAPPDPLNLFGQNWGLPPPDPLALRRAAFAPLAELWRSNMQCAGALRIDHVLGLVRLFWIPEGAPATEGAYVRYPWQDLLGVLAAQSQQNHCMVVGEDLGTVPEGLRDAMRDAGILSYRLLPFEQHDGRFLLPREYPAEALVAGGSHDLPSLPMWWCGEDIELRTQLGLWPSEAARSAEFEQRHAARRSLADALQQEGLGDGNVPDEAPVEAIHAYLARTPCKLLMLQFEDALGLHVQINLPGTTDQHPNWRHRLPCTVAEALGNARVQRIAAIMAGNGRVAR